MFSNFLFTKGNHILFIMVVANLVSNPLKITARLKPFNDYTDPGHIQRSPIQYSYLTILEVLRTE